MFSVKHAQSLASAPGRQSRVVLGALAVLALAFVFRVGVIDRPPEFDELYHLLAAQGWLETGRPTILDGEYRRAMGFTGAVAWIFAATGSATLETGRLVSVAAGSLIPMVLFLWLLVRAGWIAALTGAALAILSPQAIEEAQTLRFYSLQVLVFLMGAIAAFETTQSRGPRGAGWAALALIGLGMALYLQINSAIGIVAILGWAGSVVVLPVIWRHRARWTILGVVGLAGLVAIAAVALSDVPAKVWSLYRDTPSWAASQQDNVAYYHFRLLDIYPVFWPLFPLAALVAFRRQPRMTAYCALVFGLVFLGQSFGGMKSMRYISYAMPFLFAVLALAFREVLPAAGAAALRGADHANPTRYRWISAGLVLGACAFLMLANPFVEASLKALFGRAAFGRPEADWTRMDDLLDEWRDVPFRMTMRELHTISAVGDYDVLVAESRLDEFGDHSEFSVDPRTGRPVVGELASIAAIVRCNPEGVLMAERDWWEMDGWNDDLLPIFEAAGREVEIRSGDSLVALRWSGGGSDSEVCAELPL